MKIKKRTIPAAILLIALAVAGCANYRLGSTLPPNLTSIFVRTFVNGTQEPLIEFETTNATIQEFQKDGTLRVVRENEADAILEARLTDYKLTALRYRRDRTTTAREYRLTLLADAELKDPKTMKVIISIPGQIGEATFFVTTDLKADERNALPAAARDLAHRIVRSVVEYW